MSDYLLILGPAGPYLAIIFFLVLTGAGLPIPEEVPIVAAGVLSAPHHDPKLHASIAFACCLIGALLGDSVVYAAGRFLGRSFFCRHKWFALLLDERREEQMEALIQRHGLKAFFVARFMIGVRAPIYLAAGVMRVPWVRFILFDGISATVVVGTVFGLSFLYGNQIQRLVREFTIAFTIIVVVVVLAAVIFYLMRRRRDAMMPDRCGGENSGEAAPPSTLVASPEAQVAKANGQHHKPEPPSPKPPSDGSRARTMV